MITFKNNYLYKLSGRSPKVSGNTLLHAVNNYWHDSTGHNFEVGSGAKVLAEGNVFQNCKAPIEAGGVQSGGLLFASPSTAANAVCKNYLGRACQLNGFGSSGALAGSSDTSFLANFKGKNVASAASYEAAKNVPNTAGFGKI